MTYKGKTWCQFWALCQAHDTCGRAYTRQVEKEAREADVPVSLFEDIPECFHVVWEPELDGEETLTTGKL